MLPRPDSQGRYRRMRDEEAVLEKMRSSRAERMKQLRYMRHRELPMQVLRFERAERLLYRTKSVSFEIPTEFFQLDNLIDGFNVQELTVIAGDSNVGKAAFLLSLIRNITINKNVPTALVSSENQRTRIMRSLLSQGLGMSFEEASKMEWNNTQEILLNKASDDIKQSPLYLVDSSNTTLSTIRGTVLRLKEQSNIQILFIDRLDKMQCSDSSVSQSKKIDQLLRLFKSLALELNIPIVVTCQTEQTTFHYADTVLSLHYDIGNIRKLVLEKHPSENRGEVEFEYYPDTCQLGEIED